MVSTTETDKPSGATSYRQNQDGGGGMGKWLGLIGLVIAAVILAFFLLGGDADVDVDSGDIDVDAPSLDADIDAPDIDVETPDSDIELPDIDVDVEGGNIDSEGEFDVDIEDGDAEADAGN